MFQPFHEHELICPSTNLTYFIAAAAAVSFLGNVTQASTENFGSCNFTDFVAEAVGSCEKKFYIDLAQDMAADCRYGTILRA